MNCELNEDMADPRLYNKELGVKLDKAIYKAFTFPFYADDHCKPDGSSHCVPDRHFRLGGHLVVLYNIRLFPGLTFRAVTAHTGDFNVFTQEVEFEIDIPTIGGYFYIVSESKTVRPVHVRGSFEIKYDCAIASGITNFFLNGPGLGIYSMAMNFDLGNKPKVRLYSHRDDYSIGELDSDREANGMKIAEVLWPSVHPLLYWILRDKLWKMGAKFLYHDRISREQFTRHEKRRRDKAGELLNEIITNVKRKLRAKTVAGRLPMPDFDLMVAAKTNPDENQGRFTATSGWLGNVASMRVVPEATAVHVRHDDDLVIVGQIKFNDWKFCYDEYTMKGTTGLASGEIVRTLGDNEAFVEINATQDVNGKVSRFAKIQYINATNVSNDITGLGKYDWLKSYVNCWMCGVMDEQKPTLNKLLTDTLTEVVADVDMFAFWKELNAQRVQDEVAMSEDSSEDEDYQPESDPEEDSEDDSSGNSINHDWEIL